MSKIIKITLMIAVITVADAIQCKFVYKETDVVTPVSNIVWPNDPTRLKPPTTIKYDETKNVPFECEDPTLEDFIPIDLGNVSVNNRVNGGDDDFALVEEICQSRKRTIAPKELNNINNKLKKIAVVQSFIIEECVNLNLQCSSQPVPANKKVICDQKYLTIILTALDEGNKKTEEPFYYPSACVCATFMRKSDV